MVGAPAQSTLRSSRSWCVWFWGLPCERVDSWAIRVSTSGSHVWGMDWFASSLASARIPHEVEGYAIPSAGVLWYIDLLGACDFRAVHGGRPARAWIQSGRGGAAGPRSRRGFALGRALGGSGFVASAAMSSAPSRFARG